MPYVPPANRRNQHSKRWMHALYPTPKSDKTGILSRLTDKANTVIANVSFRYRAGMRVEGKAGRFKTVIVGTIETPSSTMGLIEYMVKDDTGNRHWIKESDIQVISITGKAA